MNRIGVGMANATALIDFVLAQPKIELIYLYL